MWWMAMSDVLKIRKAIIEAIPPTANYGESPNIVYVYTPPAHEKALRLESSLIIGARGVGKSFWTAAIGDANIRSELGAVIGGLRNAKVHIGFSNQDDIDSYPDKSTFDRLLGKDYSPYEIWRSVVSRWAAKLVKHTVPCENWLETVKWVQEEPEYVTRLLQKTNAYFETHGELGLVLFDALDRCNDDWKKMDEIVRDLLKVVLWLKSYSKIFTKVFLRTDQYSRQVMDFPDASKLSATRVELTWQIHDLHGLLWQLLCNAPAEHGEKLRHIYETVLKKPPIQYKDNKGWSLSEKAKRDGTEQRELFKKLAGPYMGTDQRRGIPYLWSVKHLADGTGQTSPRSFLEAIRNAADDSSEKYLDHPYALHYESIKRGVQAASAIRIDEVAEDYPWITELFKPLERLNVPCEFSDIEERWETTFSEGVKALQSKDRLPPQRLKEGWTGIRKDLERIGLFESLQDGRVNMPDLYRVGFKLGRKGGVKPVNRG
jgi:hypothetical protein